MANILAAMAPAAAMAIAAFGVSGFRVMAMGVAAAILTEAACDKFMDRETQIHDLHAVVVGLSFSFLLPASAPWWLVAVGSAISIVLGKMVFGGLGGSPFCAPLIGWAVCRLSWPLLMDLDASMLSVELSYPLAQLKNFGLDSVKITDLGQLFMGRQLGGLGAVQIAGVLIGGIYLIVRKHISWIIPAGVIAGMLITAGLFNAADPEVYAPASFHLLTGSALFGAFFLATDGPSSPNRRIPMLLFGLVTGVMIIIIRVYGVYPDGTPFAILLASLCTPVFERIRPKPFGVR
jgi:electron transport complex protein RnfD